MPLLPAISWARSKRVVTVAPYPGAWECEDGWVSPEPRILLLDTASLYYRAFFGIPDSLKAPDGTVVNALRGLLDFVASLTVAYEPDAIVACWDDAWRPDWRVALMPTYKTHRLADPNGGAEDTPELLSPQVPLIAEALKLVGVPVVGAPDCEADDVIGTITDQWGGPVDVVTGDRDLFQLVNDDRVVRVLYTARGVRLHDQVDNAWIKAKYDIEASQYVDFAVMRGDPSDGIPGVAGIGEKTAAALIASYGDLAGIQSAAADPNEAIKPKIRENLLAAGDYIEAAIKVVTVRPDAFELGDYKKRPLSNNQKMVFEEFGEKWGLGGVTERLLKALA